MKQLLTLALIGIINLLTIGAVNADLYNGLVAYYPFNGNANDESGKGNNGTVEGATLAEDRFGNADRAYSFDGDDYINAGNIIKLNKNNALSIAVWVKSEGYSGGIQGIVSKYAYNSFSGWGLFLIRNRYYYEVLNGSNLSIISSASNISESWRFIVGVYDGTYLKIYIEGVLEREKAVSSDILVSNNYDLLFGAYYGSNGTSIKRYFKGIMDDIRIYNRSLSETEIQVLYNETNQDCIIRDNDDDGVPNQWDKCSNTPNNSYVDKNGCAYSFKIVDTDNDGVIDEQDSCTKTPENSCVNNKGCSCELSLVDENGSVAKGKWKTYYANVDNTYSNFIVKIQNLTGDVDLYVKKGNKPGFDNYDCRPYKGGNRDETCDLKNSGENLWYFSVYGYESGNFSISVKAKR